MARRVSEHSAPMNFDEARRLSPNSPVCYRVAYKRKGREDMSGFLDSEPSNTVEALNVALEAARKRHPDIHDGYEIAPMIGVAHPAKSGVTLWKVFKG